MTNKIIGTIAVLALIVGGFAFLRPSQVVQQVAPATTNSNLGSVVGPDLNSPFWDVNGVFGWYNNQAMMGATTTPCSYLVPVDSYLESATISVTTGTSTASGWLIATSSVPNATTSPLMAFVLPSSTVRNFVYLPGATTTPTGIPEGGLVLHKGDYLNVGASGATTIGGMTFVGSCKTVIKQF